MNTEPSDKPLLSAVSRKKLGLIIASFLVFVATLSILAYEGTKKTVALVIDGEQVVVKTHAKTIDDVLKELNIEIKDVDFLSHPRETEVKNKLHVIWEPARQIALVDGNEEKQFVWTTAKTVEEFFASENITVSEHDKINFSLEDKLIDNMNLTIERAFPLVLKDGNGEEEEAWTTSATVADFLVQQGVTLGNLDRVEPMLDENVEPNGVVNVIRVEKVTDVVEEPIDFAVVTKKDESLAKGTEKVVQEGEKGLLKKEFEVTKENGVEVSRTLIAESKLKDSADKIVAVGTKELVAQVSRGQASAASTASEAAPSSGKELYVDATAFTAYCNGCSGVTATGINLRSNPNAKVIAVDPNVIPLGSKVWVEGYGNAIAGDTGGAIKGNRIDVFVPTKEQAYRFGTKKVKIRILN
ncbi:ubiquitin-like domain-containing protein [Bacillus sp. FJAT-50079]|uniref:ubiquitin-like domain-containing protein n=1 Tax=Bacillus sp. FJAT-50079 TaxID=2833577 RepID=UPI0032D59AB7